jgi:hypothetical protein
MRTTSSKIYFVQAVKYIDQDVKNTLEAFVSQQRSRTNKCYYCIIEGRTLLKSSMLMGMKTY